MDVRERREAGKKALLTRAIEAALVVLILLMIVGLLTPPARLPLVSPVPLTPLAGERLKIGETKEVAWDILLVPHAADWGCTRKAAELRPRNLPPRSFLQFPRIVQNSPFSLNKYKTAHLVQQLVGWSPSRLAFTRAGRATAG